MLPPRHRRPDGRAPITGAPSWMTRTDSIGRWLGTLFCGGGVLTLISLALPRHFIDSPVFVAVVAIGALVIGTMLLRGALNDNPPRRSCSSSPGRTSSSPSGPTSRATP
jgi:hypothetical protein